MAVEVKTSLIAGARCILEGQAAGSEAVCLSDPLDLPRTWGDLSQTINNILLQSIEGDGTKTFSERVLPTYHESPHAIARERYSLYRRDFIPLVDVSWATVDKAGNESSIA